MTGAFIGDVQITDDDVDVLERLLDVDGVNGMMYIYDTEMCQALKRGGYVQERGGWLWGTKRLRSLLPKLQATMDKIANRD